MERLQADWLPDFSKLDAKFVRQIEMKVLHLAVEYGAGLDAVYRVLQSLSRKHNGEGSRITVEHIESEFVQEGKE